MTWCEWFCSDKNPETWFDVKNGIVVIVMKGSDSKCWIESVIRIYDKNIEDNLSMNFVNKINAFDAVFYNIF